MRGLIRLLSALSLCMVTRATGAQLPNLSGKWILSPVGSASRPRSDQPSGTARGVAELTIVQDRDRLILSRDDPTGPVRSEFRLDGTESKNYIRAAGKLVPRTSRARWDNGKLIVSSSAMLGGRLHETTKIYSLDPSGSLVIEVRDVSGGRVIAAKSVYRRDTVVP
jgi:hypothetical protein